MIAWGRHRVKLPVSLLARCAYLATSISVTLAILPTLTRPLITIALSFGATRSLVDVCAICVVVADFV